MENTDKIILVEQQPNPKEGMFGIFIGVIIGIVLFSLILWFISLGDPINPFTDFIRYAQTRENNVLILPFGILIVPILIGISFYFVSKNHKIIYIDQNSNTFHRESATNPDINLVLSLDEIEGWYLVNRQDIFNLIFHDYYILSGVQ